MQIGVIGINHKLANVNLRELVAKVFLKRFNPDRLIHPHQSFVLLSTCNRTELYFSSENLADTHTNVLLQLKKEMDSESDQKLYSYFGRDCFQHLARVTAGLDSAIIFETEIVEQVRAAYKQAASKTTLSSSLHYLFQKCLMLGKKVRTSIGDARGLPNLEHAIYSTGKTVLSNVDQPNVLFVGASDINLKILRYLKRQGIENITLTNRTDSKAIFHQQHIDIKSMPWKNLHLWQTYDWIIFGTKSLDYLIAKSDTSKSKKDKKLIIDLCIPPNVNPVLKRNPSIHLLNIDEINHSLKIREKRMHHFIADAESFITTHSERQTKLYSLKEHKRQLLQAKIA